ncbi:sodium/solute symporter [Paucibacter sp. PLA-PC-4]|uniref:sodium:solute symporter family transporter n=1 Tax=Paucibacter sp. PLA-PC-4 TaxID=2993655 RepID=UPI002248BBC5|nr:sodium/solute symporter [Paucibacter sp. PLA-PC-4]MCX2860333.1 sodium/solute symporter [Paucibacter sp. PLA-PC-4]
MTTPDWLIIVAYLASTLGLSAWLARSQQTAADYYVGDRSMPWWALAISTLATQSSANSFLGIPAFVALVPGGGLTWLQYELALPLAMVVVMLVLVPVFRGLALISVYEYLERRFDRPTRLALSAVFLLSRGLATGVALYAAAVVVQVCTGLPLPWCVMLMGGLTVVYDTMGGMRAVVWTDVLQMAVLLVGIVVCGWVAWGQLDGAAALLAAHEPARLAAIEAAHGLGDGAKAPFWGFVVGGLVLYISYYGVDQSQVQRQLAARDVAGAQRVLLFNGLARFPLTLLYAGLGLAVGAVYWQNEALRSAVPPGRLDYLIPRYIELFLPAGLRGLLVAAILAAAMSSLDSALNSLSAATLRDFVEPHVAPRRQLLAGRLVTVGWGVLIVAFGLTVGDLASSVVEGINRVGALFYGPLLAAFACGILDRRTRGPAVLMGVAAGLLLNLALAQWLGAQLFWMWWNLSGLLAAVVVTWLASRCMAPPRPEQLVGTTLSTAQLAQGLRGQRKLYLWLLCYGALALGVACWLGVRAA